MTYLSHLAICFSLGSWLLFTFIANYLHRLFPGVLTDHFGVFAQLMRSPVTWSLVTIIPVACLLPDLALMSGQMTFKVPKSKVKEEEPEVRERLMTLTKSEKRSRSKMQLEELAHGFAFSDTTSATVCEEDCIRAYSKTYHRPAKRRPSTVHKRSKSIV